MGLNYHSYSTRFFRKEYPEVDDVVMVNVRSIEEMGAYVNLLEYNNMEGMVLLSELSRRRFRSINKLMKVGKSEAVVVIRVDKEKNYIDLSKRRVAQPDVKKCNNRYIRNKTVISILTDVAENIGIKPGKDFESFLERTIWTLEDSCKMQGGTYDIFKQALKDDSVLAPLKLSDAEKEALLLGIHNRLEPKRMKLRADFELACYRYEGIEAVRESLREGLKFNNPDEEIEIKINLIAPPMYVMTLFSFDKEAAINIMKRALRNIEINIAKYEGHFKLLIEPFIVSDVEDAEFAQNLNDLENENAEVSGDSSEYSTDNENAPEEEFNNANFGDDNEQ